MATGLKSPRGPLTPKRMANGKNLALFEPGPLPRPGPTPLFRYATKRASYATTDSYAPGSTDTLMWTILLLFVGQYLLLFYNNLGRGGEGSIRQGAAGIGPLGIGRSRGTEMSQ